MSRDFELKLERFLKVTILLWLYPYILWFFARRYYRWLMSWLTEPGPSDEDSVTRI